VQPSPYSAGAAPPGLASTGQPGYNQAPPSYGQQPAYGQQPPYGAQPAGQYPASGQYPPPGGSGYSAPNVGYGGASSAGAAPGYGGYGGTQYAPPRTFAQGYMSNIPRADQLSWEQKFQISDKDHSGFLTLTELEDMIIGSANTVFSQETAKALLKVFDSDRGGRIEMNEFCAMNQFVSQLHAAFTAEDRDRSRKLTVNEVAAALTRENLNFDLATVHRIVEKFAYVSSYRSRASLGQPYSPSINFEEFVRLSATIASAKDAFMRRDQGQTGRVSMTLAEFVGLVAEI